MSRTPVQATAQIYRMPLLIAAVSAIGLASALLGDGVWDVLSWAVLGLPVAVACFFWVRSSNGKSRRR
jgi:hypothetical protein